MRALLKWTAIATGLVTGLFVAAWILATTQRGQDFAAPLISSMTGGRVAIKGLSGIFPSGLRAKEVTISDDRGPWLILGDVAVDGTVLSLIRNHIAFRKVTSAHAQVLRVPQSSSEDPSMPRIDLESLDVADLETSAELSSVPMHFSAVGSLHMQSLRDVATNVTLKRLDGSGTYWANGAIQKGVANGVISVDEAANGFFTGFLRLKDIGPIKAEIRGEGPPEANTIIFTTNAGALQAKGRGTVDVPRRTINVDFSASSPAMDLRQDLAWQSLAAEGHARGRFDSLALDIRLTVAKLKGNGVAAAMLRGTAKGTTGEADFTAEASGLEISGFNPKFFAGGPASLRAHADLRMPRRPLTFTLTHPVLNASGMAYFDGAHSVSANVTLPKLEPYAALLDLDAAGRANFAAKISFTDDDTRAHVTLDGSIAATGGDPIIAGLVGRSAPFTLTADVRRGDVSNLRARVKGVKADATFSGAIRDNVLDLAVAGTVSDVSLVVPDLKGLALLKATAKGPARTARLDATVSGTMSTPNITPQQVKLSLQGRGFRKPLIGTFQGESIYANAPISLSGTFDWRGRTIALGIQNGQWRSVTASGGDVVIPFDAPFTANATLHVAQIADLEPFLGTPLSGTADGTVRLERRRGQAVLVVDTTGHGVRVEDITVTTLAASGDVVDPFAKPRLALKLSGTGVSAAGLTGGIKGDLSGPMDALAIKATGDLKGQDDRPIKVDAGATLGKTRGELALGTLTVAYRDTNVKLARPATIHFAKGISVDKIELRSGEAQFLLSGQFTPTLAADVTFDNVGAELLRPYVPDLSQGTLKGSAQLTGTMQAPRGMVSIEGRQLRMIGLSESLPAGTLVAHADLQGDASKIDASLAFGPSKLTVTGQAPIAANATFDLHVAGTTDLSLLNPEFTAVGRRAIGQVTLNAAVNGTRDAPNMSGNVRLANAEVQDYVRGIRVTGISASGLFRGKTAEITQFSGRAGAGTISAKGTIDVLAPDMPVNLTITARSAEVSDDTFHANVDADLTANGTAAKRLTIAGKVTVRRGESLLQDSLPPTVATINVVRKGKATPAQTRATTREGIVVLDLTISSPGLFFIRGRGLDAEVRGDVHVTGPLDSLVTTGGFEMRQGTFDLGAATLTFTSGKVTFAPGSLRDRLDPELDFLAETNSGGYTAKLEISGTVSRPRVQLTSTPPLPQDEILAQLLFQQNVKQLTPLQLAAMAQAAGALAGFGTGLNPLASIRKTLGLDRLSVVTGANNQTEVEAGKYVTRNVFVGAKQGLSSSPQAEVQIDINKNLKAKATVATGTNAATTTNAYQQDPGSSIGLSWQFEY
jgi:translocation and assembly module TamB